LPGSKLHTLTCHNTLKPPEHTAQHVTHLSFHQQSQTWLETAVPPHSFSYEELRLGKGRIFWCAYPIELASGEEGSAQLYSHVAARLEIEPQFEAPRMFSGTLAYPIQFEDSVLYVFVSDTSHDEKIDYRDNATGS